MNDAVMSFQGWMLIEMASLYGRHMYIRDKEMECLTKLSKLLEHEAGCESICQEISWILKNNREVIDEKKYR